MLKLQNEMNKSKKEKQHGAGTVTQSCRPSAPPPAFKLKMRSLPLITCYWLDAYTHQRNVQSVRGVAEQQVMDRTGERENERKRKDGAERKRIKRRKVLEEKQFCS